MPSAVDSAAVAGVVEILHTQSCFALSIRYAVCRKYLSFFAFPLFIIHFRTYTLIALRAVGLSTSRIGEEVDLPAHMDYVRLAQFFEAALDQQVEGTGHTLDFIGSMPEERQFLEELVISLLYLELHDEGALLPFAKFITADEEGGSSLAQFVRVVIDGKLNCRYTAVIRCVSFSSKLMTYHLPSKLSLTTIYFGL